MVLSFIQTTFACLPSEYKDERTEGNGLTTGARRQWRMSNIYSHGVMEFS